MSNALHPIVRRMVLVAHVASPGKGRQSSFNSMQQRGSTWASILLT